MNGTRRWVGYMGSSARFVLASLIGGFGCGNSGQTPGVPSTRSASTDGATSTDGASSSDAETSIDGGGTCNAPMTPANLCKRLPSGTVTACSLGAGGEPSSTGYLEILGADGSKTYVCATSWTGGGSGGYFFGFPDQFMTDPQSCCGGAPTPTPAPMAPQPAFGKLGALQVPKDIKPQEMLQPGAGSIRENPFATVLSDPSGAAAFSSARANWLSWAGDGNPHPAPDGTGAYYFPAKLLINYAILETIDSLPIVVIGPEVSLAADSSTPLGHPTLGGCLAGGGAPLVLMAGELVGTILTNHSGRYGHESAVTPDALDNAASLFKCLGVQITGTTYYAPKN